MSGYPLSPMQKGMLFHQLFEPTSGADLEQMVLRFSERIDPPTVAAAWEEVAQRHEVLRTSFPAVTDGEPIQIVHDRAPMELAVVDQSAYNRGQREDRLQQFLDADRRRGFDPEQAPLSRITIFERPDETAVLVWSFHHIILDGRSFPIVLADFFAAYDALRAGQPVALEPSIPYRIFIEALAQQDPEPAREYWRKTLAGFRAPTPLPVSNIGAVPADAEGYGEVQAVLDEASTAALDRLAAEQQVTVNTVLQGAWSLLLSRYSGETDVVFGATRSGRHGVVDGAETMAGLFINTLPMRVAVDDDSSIGEWLRDIRAQHLTLRDYEQIPLVDVQGLSEISSGTRLFESILVYETYQLDPMMRARTGTGDRVRYELLEQTNHQLLLSVYGGQELELRLEYDRSLFAPAVAERMAGHVMTLLRSLANPAAELVGDIECIDDAESDLVLRRWNRDRSMTSGPAGSIVDAWRHRVETAPAAPAVVAPADTDTDTDTSSSSSSSSDGDANTDFGSTTIDVAGLDTRSDQLARHLRRHGVGNGDVVGILLDRSVDAIAAMLAVLKSGAAYLPLDPDYPVERLRYMLNDSSTDVVVTADRQLAASGLSDLIEGDAITPILIDRIEHDAGPAALLPDIDPDWPAYMIYTSGSTGRPKGVVVPHRALANHAEAMIEAYGLGPEDRVLQFAALSFDVAAEEIYPTLLAGARLVLRTPAVATDFDELERFVAEHEVSVLNLPAAFWSSWLDHVVNERSGSVPETIRLVVTGSEKVSTDDYRRWRTAVGSSVRWLNAYGPTEATITASVFDPIGADPAPGSAMPIGRPIANTALYVLDRRGRPAPIGVGGELLIGGRGVALGYHQRRDLTADKFVTDPVPGAGRCYRTGDLARWLPDGNVEFLGRVDDQVKVRGFRIELGEIETALRTVDGVAQAAVVARPDGHGNDQLVAHIVLDGSAGTDGEGFDTSRLRSRLEERLPTYMIPVAFGTVDALPIAPSGKVDRAALPDIEVTTEPRARVGPRSEMERQLADIWTEVLGIEDIGVHDNFFDIGGNSLSAIRLFSAVRSMTGERLQLPELFAAPSVAELAALLGDQADGDTGGRTDRSTLPSWVFPVKASGSKPPLFHLGGASVLRSLADHFPEDQPLYALLEQDLGADHFYTTVDEIVDHCLRGIRAAQPEGPYLIAGLCFGGVVALEMSRRLRADGHEVALTVMIDSFAPGVVDADELAERQAEATGGTGATAPSAKPGPKSRTRMPPSRIARKVRRRAWRKAWGPMHNAFERTGVAMPSWLRDVEEANTIASDVYRATPYDGDVTLFVATGNSGDLAAGSSNGWDRYIEGELRITEVAGGHVSMYEEPYVAGLAEDLLRSIAQIQSK